MMQQVIETLNKDLPTLFEKDITYDIYSQDILFRDPVNKYKGKPSYHIVYWTLRFHARLFFTDIHFDLHNITPSNENTIIANWTVRGTLRLPWQPKLYFNGYSTYKLNQNGLIYEHIDTWDRKPSEILKQFFQKPTS